MTGCSTLIIMRPAWANSRIDELQPLVPDDLDAIKQKLSEKAKW